MTFSTFASPGVGLQGGGGSGGGGTASLPISGNGATITTSTPLINGTQTWNSGATTFTSLLLNVTDTASAAGSLLMDLQVGGSSQFSVASSVNVSTRATNLWIASATNAAGGIIRCGANSLRNLFILGTSSSDAPMVATATGLTLAVNNSFAWSPNSTPSSTPDLFLTRRAAANLRLGAADAAAPVAQTLSVQSVVAGTSNTAGANLTITGSQGTGTGAGGSIIFQVAPAGSSGTAQNALADALTINSAGLLQFAGTTSSFPALKRSSTALETKLADDSAYAPHAMQYLDVTDGITAPASATGRARIYVDTADGDLKVIFADGTVKTIVTDT